MPKPTKPEKAKNFKSSSKELLKSLKRYYFLIILSVIFSIGSTAVAIIGPQKVSEITNEISAGISGTINIQNIFDIMVFLIGICLFSIVCEVISNFLMINVSQNFSKKLRSDIAKKINKIPLKLFDSKPVGDILSIVTNDVDVIFDGLYQGVGNLMYSIAVLIGVLVMMFITNWQMSLTAIGSSLIGFILVGLIMSRAHKYFEAQQRNLGTINGYIEEMYSGHNVISVYNAVGETKEQFEKYNKELYKSTQKAAFLGGIMQPLMMFVGNFGYVAVCIVGAILAMKEVIDFGTIIAFVFYVRLFSNPLSTIAQSLGKMQIVVAAAERIFNFLKEDEMSSEEQITDKLSPKKVKGNVEFKNVKFAYDERLIIKNFSANIKAGQKVAIVGPTGAGKTIVNLLMKFYDINDGDILIDGHSIKNLTRENVHNLFCMVLQNTWLFKGTIKENIAYNQSKLSDKEIVQACKFADIDEFINSLPNKYDTILEDNQSLSEGQKQLITIARAIVDDSPFLILDEATSSVDRKTDEVVQRAMDELTKDRTSFIIAHRLSTIQNADLILVLNDGDIIEQGTHDELLKKNGFYADLYNSQFEI